MAFRVQLDVIETGPEYSVPVVEVGVEPSVVYLMDAPLVVVAMVTDCELE
jgi:hypothetical protein